MPTAKQPVFVRALRHFLLGALILVTALCGLFS